MIRTSRKTYQGPWYSKAALFGSSFLLLAATAVAAQPAASPVAVSAVQEKAAPAQSRGAMLAISPLRVELDGAGAAQTLRLANSGGVPMIVQTRVFSWTQDGGADEYAPSNAVVASPAIATVQPGQTQIIRLFRTAPVGSAEKAFRISIDQIPDAKSPESVAAATRLRFLVPMFLDRAAAPSARLQWTQSQSGLTLANSGGRTARIAWVKLFDASGRQVPSDSGTLRYVQPGARTAWPISKLCSLGVQRVVADIDEAQVDVPLAPCG